MKNKKIYRLLILMLLVLSTVACGSKKKIDVVFYNNSNVPTFTCVTGIEVSDETILSNGVKAYIYDCSEKDMNKYMKYLKEEQNFASVDSNDGLPIYTLAKSNDTRVILTYTDGKLYISPYSIN